jgi:hypothetical protein
MSRAPTFRASVMAALLLTGCAAAISDRGFVRDKTEQDQFAFRIHTAGFAGAETADAQAQQEIQKFMDKEGYRRYHIVNRRHHLVPAYYDYIVRFWRD